MKNQEWDNTIRKLFSEVYSHAKFDLMDQIFDPNVRLNDPAVPQFKGGLAALKTLEKEYEQALPGKILTIKEIIHGDDKIVVLWECKGTHKGTFQGVKASNKKITTGGISIYSFNDQGKIKEITQFWDRYGFFEQIGEIHNAHAHAR